MGLAFSHQVFAPAVAQAFAEHRAYEDVRDRLRAAWTARYRRRAGWQVA